MSQTSHSPGRDVRTAGAAGRYDHRAIEARWQARWERTRLYETELQGAERPFYNLMMFPYPSAEGLHVGNVYAYVGADAYGRFVAMKGQDVFEPIGFDAFGIHTENFAIRRGEHPRALTARNIERFRETQLKRIGNRFDWGHEVRTTDPRYYKWTQWIFLQFFKAGLAVRRKGPVNWCPSCKTVLADEQVTAHSCERCGTTVTRRELEQWFFTITRYAGRLLDNLDRLDWSEVVKTAQRNWIGRSEGLRFSLRVQGRPGVEIPVFTTRPDTVFGMTYVVLAPEHPLIDQLVTQERRAAVEAYREGARRRSELERLAGTREKTGEFIGAYAINPVNEERVPIWIAEYVLSTYGTGAIMAVPAHDERDFEFANCFGLPIRQVVVPVAAEGAGEGAPALSVPYLGEGVLADSGPFTGLPSREGARRIAEWFEAKGLGQRAVQYRLRDWLISRQRYWGPPIPIVYCDSCGTVPVPEDQLPVLLPDAEDWLPTGTGSSPLARMSAFVDTPCPRCGDPARRETDVSDNFLDSAWYFLRYPSTEFDDCPFDRQLTAKWLPVDMYIGGPEHSVLHLLYSRFITMALHDLGYLAFDEPFERFRAHGWITKDGSKMSKSRGNVVNPDEYLQRFGADTLRTYLLFLGPFERGGEFTDRGMGGVGRFLQRAWRLSERLRDGVPAADARRRLHRAIHTVTEDVRSLSYNTAIAALMEYLNALESGETISREEFEAFVQMLAPFAPHLAEELWERLGRAYSVHQQAWPKADPALLARERVTVAVQIDGRTRATVELPPDTPEQEALAKAMQVATVRHHVRDSAIRRVVYVPGRVLNIVT